MVIITSMNMPIDCAVCDYGLRWDNGSTTCRYNPFSLPRKDGEARPEWCPVKELVLCKDCKKYGKDDCRVEHYDYSDDGTDGSFIPSANWFCADGVKKGNEGEG